MLSSIRSGGTYAFGIGFKLRNDLVFQLAGAIVVPFSHSLLQFDASLLQLPTRDVTL